MGQSYNEIIQFAAKNRGEGRIIEPRFYYDSFDVNGNSDPAAFKNGEQFPVRLTHLIVSPLPYVAQVRGGPTLVYAQPSITQTVFLRVERYGEFYQSETTLRASSWANVNVAPPPALNGGQVVHRFAQPVVLGMRDSFRVEFAPLTGLQSATFAAFPPHFNTSIAMTPAADFSGSATVQFAGVGMMSGRPYIFGGPATISGNKYIVDASLLQNAGNEPVALTEVTVTGLAPLNIVGDTLTGIPQAGSVADARLWSMQVRQIGSGTQADWFSGPVITTPVPRMPLSLLGTHMGNALVHEFPGDGLTLEPGEMMRVNGTPANATDNTGQTPILYQFPTYVAFAGYLMVT